ncbi:hypothetical protein J1614_009565 [Plenodomus biglobosus]|nr:hypothetical protein J1614_009565 [Plenodomus biglobosus]
MAAFRSHTELAHFKISAHSVISLTASRLPAPLPLTWADFTQISQDLHATSSNMARGVMAQISGMASNPYPRPKDQQAINTICEICDRSIRTLDWVAHKNSKKHREAEAKERGETHVANGTTISNGFGDDSNGFTPDTNGINEFGTTDTFANAGNTGGDSWAVSTGGDAWGSSGGNTDALSYGNKAGNGGGDRTCYGCGLPGHQKRDCPSGSGSAGMACYGCGEIGHQKRDCPKGSGGGQTCFNCGDPG